MKVKELIEQLKECDPEAEVFYGSDERAPEDGLPGFTLFDFIVEKHPKVRSWGNCSPRWSYKENVVVLVYD